jgi:flagellar biosynthesis protein FliQ
VNPDQAIETVVGMLKVAMVLCGPVLGASLTGGILVGVLQTATQINEASIGYVFKSSLVILVLLVAGPTLMDHLLTYARHSFEAVAFVVR